MGTSGACAEFRDCEVAIAEFPSSSQNECALVPEVTNLPSWNSAFG